MPHSQPKPARTRTRGTRSRILAAVVFLGALLIGVAASPFDTSRDDTGPAVDPGSAIIGIASGQPGAQDRNQRDHGARRSRGPAAPPRDAFGHARQGMTVFGDDAPRVANLDPELRSALRQAAADAARDGVQLDVNSGWRSPEEQEQLLRDAIAEYGSEEKAARWVATPETSPHVSGDAVDIGPSVAAAWLSEHGSEYGLCQIYRNEPWHYELRPQAVVDGCPVMYANPTHDPRMQQ